MMFSLLEKYLIHETSLLDMQNFKKEFAYLFKNNRCAEYFRSMVTLGVDYSKSEHIIS